MFGALKAVEKLTLQFKISLACQFIPALPVKAPVFISASVKEKSKKGVSKLAYNNT